MPEPALHLFALAGASPASLLSMWMFHHKTRKPGFYFLYAFFLLVQGAGAGYWFGVHR